uniref:Uncharacterized protein n=1 Tax=Glossina pallidipes TaxID=7398 RepID=A0A1B0A776_GLOPL
MQISIKEQTVATMEKILGVDHHLDSQRWPTMRYFRFIEQTVKASDASVVKVTSYTKAHGTLQYKITILKEFPIDEQFYVNVHSPATMQDIQSSMLDLRQILNNM